MKNFDLSLFDSFKGDGRYLLSNCKDQSIKLWDMRHLSSKKAQDVCFLVIKKIILIFSASIMGYLYCISTEFDAKYILIFTGIVMLCLEELHYCSVFK